MSELSTVPASTEMASIETRILACNATDYVTAPAIIS